MGAPFGSTIDCCPVSVGGASRSTAAWFYLHDNDESQLGSQNMPELHCVGVLPLMAGRVAVITVPTKKKHFRDLAILQIFTKTLIHCVMTTLSPFCEEKGRDLVLWYKCAAYINVL